MKRIILNQSYWILALLLIAVGCTLPGFTPPTPPPTRTPRPTATPLPTSPPSPSPTPVPPPPATATPSAGYYRNPELGFWFLYPEDWLREETGDEFPAVIVSDDNDPVRLLAGSWPVEEGTELIDFTRDVAEDLGLGEDVELVDSTSTTIGEGIPSHEIVLAWEDEEGHAFQARGYTAVSGENGYVLLLVAHSEVMETRLHTVEAIGRTFHLEQPELFGISRAEALVLLTAEPETLDPALTREGPGSLAAHLFSGLVRLNADLQVEPDLAESWETSPDGTTYTFHLHPDATFHSGRALTAEDVRLAWERATDTGLGSPTAPLYLGDILGAEEKLAGEADSLEGVEVVDEHTLVVTLDGPKPYFLFKLAQPVAFVTQPEDVERGPSWWERPDGSGPFTLHAWRDEEAIILERNAAHPNPPALPAVIYFLSSGYQFPAYEAGRIDVAVVDPPFLDRVLDPADPLAADRVSGNTFCTHRVVFDTTRPPFDDPAIRRAFSLAIDRQQLAEVVLNDAAVPATGFLPPGMPGYTERPVEESFDPQAARVLIAGADLDELTFIAPGRGEADPLATALADLWTTHLDVSIETELLDPSGYADAINRRPGHLFLVEECARYPDPENVLDLPYHSESPFNRGDYASSEVDSLLEAARTESDPATRLTRYQEVEALLLEDMPAAPVLHPRLHVLVRPYVQNYHPAPIPVLWPAFVAVER
jgi:ABC-type transport system substrate-binding protein